MDTYVDFEKNYFCFEYWENIFVYVKCLLLVNKVFFFR